MWTQLKKNSIFLIMAWDKYFFSNLVQNYLAHSLRKAELRVSWKHLANIWYQSCEPSQLYLSLIFPHLRALHTCVVLLLPSFTSKRKTERLMDRICSTLYISMMPVVEFQSVANEIKFPTPTDTLYMCVVLVW